MPILSVALNWIHILCVVVFLGTMFVATFMLMPVLKSHLEYEQRQKFIVNFIPRVRSVMGVIVVLLITTGIVQLVLLRFGQDAQPERARLAIFGLKMLFAAVPLIIFVVAPKVLGRKSKEKLCCDPDAKDATVFMGVMTSTGTLLHYAAIGGGWLAVLFAIILARMS